MTYNPEEELEAVLTELARQTYDEGRADEIRRLVKLIGDHKREEGRNAARKAILNKPKRRRSRRD